MVFHEYERSLFVIMDDGYPPVSILILIGFILLEAMFYGFGSAIQNVNEGKLEEEAAGGNKKAARLLEIVNRPVRFVHTIQVTTHLMGMIIGAAILPAMIGMVERRFLLGKVLAWAEPAQLMAMSGTPWYRNPSWWQWAGVLALVTVFVLVLVISFGIIIPKRLAAKEPEKWGYHMLPVVLFAAGVFLPLTKLITLVSALVLRLFGVDLADDDDNVTEEDIMSMVNEGHEQGVLEADETEMITNIFELGDKEASDIMTHRTNMTALDGAMLLGDAPDGWREDEASVTVLLDRLLKLGCKAAVITGVHDTKGRIGAGWIDSHGRRGFAYCPKVDAYFPGTGDLFASVMLSSLLKDPRRSLASAVEKAVEFVYRCIEETVKEGTDPLEGVLLEKMLPLFLNR